MKKMNPNQKRLPLNKQCCNCHKYFPESELDLDGDGNWICNDCEQESWDEPEL